MGKRPNGDGSVFELKSGPQKGTWRASITVRTDGLGRTVRKSVRGKTQKEVLGKLRALQRLKEENALADPSRMTVGEYLDEWMKDTGAQIKPTTYEKREYIIKLYLKPHIGRHHLQKLTPLDVQRLQTTLMNTRRQPGKGQKHHKGRELAEGETLPPIGPTTVHGAIALLSSALRHALQLGLIHRNPVGAVKRVKPRRREFQPWEPAEVSRLVGAVLDDRLYGLVYLALTTGMRRGELCGLGWADIQGNVLKVQQNCVLVGNRPHLQTPKTEKSRRRISLPEDTLKVLEIHRGRQQRERDAAGEDWQETGLVFTTPIGTVYHPRNLLYDWYALLERARVRPITIHDIRHTYASLAIYQGLDPKALADRLGHAHTSTTLDVYGHVFEEQRERSALTLDALLQRGSRESLEDPSKNRTAATVETKAPKSA